MKLYTNNDCTIGFSKKKKGYNNIYNIKRIGREKAFIGMGIDTKLLLKALKKINGEVFLRVHKYKDYPCLLSISNENEICFISEYILRSFDPFEIKKEKSQ